MLCYLASVQFLLGSEKLDLPAIFRSLNCSPFDRVHVRASEPDRVLMNQLFNLSESKTILSQKRPFGQYLNAGCFFCYRMASLYLREGSKKIRQIIHSLWISVYPPSPPYPLRPKLIIFTLRNFLSTFCG